MIRVFKFGGASIKDAAGFRNVGEIIKSYNNEKLVVVISALGKTTNALEEIVKSYFAKDGKTQKLVRQLHDNHLIIMKELFPDATHPVYEAVNNTFVEIDWVIEDKPEDSYDFVYDQVVSIGELVSTKIAAAYFNHIGVNIEWRDAREFIKTDNTYREGNVDWTLTEKLIRENLTFDATSHLKLTQGFLGCTSENYTTTLGREGSDYTAAILAFCLNAKDVTIWKDVPGVLNADPRYFTHAKLIKELSYHEAIEMTYYGATVIHPKTLKPLHNKLIPLNVRSFIDKDKPGTVISESDQVNLPSTWVKKLNQCLISVSAKDFSFIAEDNLSDIFHQLADCGAKANMMQNSALSFSICVDDSGEKIEKLLQHLKTFYRTLCNYKLSLLTVRHYSEDEVYDELKGKKILLEQKSRNTIQIVYKEE